MMISILNNKDFISRGDVQSIFLAHFGTVGIWPKFFDKSLCVAPFLGLPQLEQKMIKWAGFLHSCVASQLKDNLM